MRQKLQLNYKHSLLQNNITKNSSSQNKMLPVKAESEASSRLPDSENMPTVSKTNFAIANTSTSTVMNKLNTNVNKRLIEDPVVQRNNLVMKQDGEHEMKEARSFQSILPPDTGAINNNAEHNMSIVVNRQSKNVVIEHSAGKSKPISSSNLNTSKKLELKEESPKINNNHKSSITPVGSKQRIENSPELLQNNNNTQQRRDAPIEIQQHIPTIATSCQGNLQTHLNDPQKTKTKSPGQQRKPLTTFANALKQSSHPSSLADSAVKTNSPIAQRKQSDPVIPHQQYSNDNIAHSQQVASTKFDLFQLPKSPREQRKLQTKITPLQPNNAFVDGTSVTNKIQLPNKPSKLSVSNDAVFPEPANLSVASIDGWVCPRCTLVNPLLRPGCEACAAERPETVEMPDKGPKMPDIKVNINE